MVSIWFVYYGKGNITYLYSYKGEVLINVYAYTLNRDSYKHILMTMGIGLIQLVSFLHLLLLLEWQKKTIPYSRYRYFL